MGRWKTVSKTRRPLRVVLEVLADGGTAVNASGEHTEAFAAAVELRANIDWQAGTEGQQAGQNKAMRRGTVECRYYSALSPVNKLRIKGTQRVLNIEAPITVDEVRQFMSVPVTEVV